MSSETTAPEEPLRELSTSQAFRSPIGLALIALALGIAVDVLFHGHALGISFPIWAGMAVAGLLIAARREDRRPAWQGLLLAPAIVFFAIMTAMRLEPLTVFLNLVFALSFFAIWVRVFDSGKLWDFGWLDFGLSLVFAPLVAWIRPWRVLAVVQNTVLKERGGSRLIAAVVRGLILAIPIVAIFAMLLASADLVFGDLLKDLLQWLNIDLILEWAGRGFVVIFSALFFLGSLVIALTKTTGRELIGRDKPLVNPLMGFTEAAVILVGVDLLFAIFVVIQFVYLFGGEVNIDATGYTYSEYARRGFGELVFLAFLSLGLILGLSTVTHRSRHRGWFNGLSVALIGFVGVMLVSALRRLMLYENAFGFTRLRTYTHIAIIWLGISFAAFVVVLLADNLRRFAPLAAATAVGFVVTLNLVNVDDFIVRQNVRRMDDSGELDDFYLVGLTDDAMPGLISLLALADADLQRQILPQLECRLEQTRARGLSWQSSHLSRDRSLRLLESIEDNLLSPYFAYQESDGYWQVLVKGERQSCTVQPWPRGF